MALFVAKISYDCRERELSEIFEKHGQLKRCEIKNGYAFVTFHDERDAEEAISGLNDKEFQGRRISVEWAKDSGRTSENPHHPEDRRRGRRDSYDRYDRRDRRSRDDIKCYNCNRRGHIARNCPSPRRRRHDSRSPSPRRRGSRSPRRRHYDSRSPSPRRRDSRSPRRRDSRSPRRRDSRSPRRRDSRSPQPRRDSRSPRTSRSPQPRSPPPRRDSRSPPRENGSPNQ